MVIGVLVSAVLVVKSLYEQLNTQTCTCDISVSFKLYTLLSHA